MASKRKRISKALTLGSAPGPKAVNPMALIALMPVLARYAQTIQVVSGLLPDIEIMIDEARALLDKHSETIKTIERITPEIQGLVAEGLAAMA